MISFKLGSHTPRSKRVRRSTSSVLAQRPFVPQIPGLIGQPLHQPQELLCGASSSQLRFEPPSEITTMTAGTVNQTYRTALSLLTSLRIAKIEPPHRSARQRVWKSDHSSPLPKTQLISSRIRCIVPEIVLSIKRPRVTLVGFGIGQQR